MTDNIDVHPPSRAPLYLFLAIVGVFASLSYSVAFVMGDDNRAGGIILLQFSPALAAVITKLVFQRNLRGIGWGWGKTRYQLAAYVTPFLIALISFSLVWTLGFGGFFNEAFIAEAQLDIADTFGITLTSPYVLMLVLLAINGTLGLLIAFGAVGEEIGWRGFLVPELYKHYDFTRMALISGTIWAVFHWPLLFVLMAPRLDVSPWPLMAFSLIGGIGLSTIMAWFRIKSGSVWTAILFHAALNIHNQGFFQNLTVETSYLTDYLSGEHGLMLALVAAVAGYLFWRMRGALPESASARTGAETRLGATKR